MAIRSYVLTILYTMRSVIKLLVFIVPVVIAYDGF